MLLNKEFYLYFPEEHEILIKFKKYEIRKFFDGQIQFTQSEMHSIQQFKQKYQVQKEDSFILRMLYATKFKFEKCFDAIKNFDEWRQSIDSKVNPMSQELLKQGVIYMHGRDNRFRPILVVNARKVAGIKEIDLLLQSMTVFLDYILSNCMLPGQIENWIVIMDLGGLGIMGLPKQDLYRIMNYLSSNYRSRMHKCYVINCNKALSITWAMIKTFLEDITVYKILFESCPISLLQYANPSQLEKKYGGIANDKSENFWPPQEISPNYQIAIDNIKLIDQLTYIELFKQGRLNKNIVCQELIKLQQLQQNNQQIKQQQKSEDDFQSCEEDNDL
ncbi:unnamed protein product [Paramecium pentaurelia]|uniref:CRAL-TRIO domain-containing protein n=1 Tax=Paramecium pentaurelia TaxID=43138 RepID=A0A8S1TX43_9CILI|nr:unnamed protein product [Paramecium pentaurelia]